MILAAGIEASSGWSAHDCAAAMLELWRGGGWQIASFIVAGIMAWRWSPRRGKAAE